jgi:hypothetical protein
VQIPGKILVLATFGIGVAMAAGAWWYNYQQSYRAAEFWGARDAAQLVGNSQLKILSLMDRAVAEPSKGDSAPQVIAGRNAVEEADLTGKPGLVHLRHALTYDANFAWDQRRAPPDRTADWAFAFQFAKDEATPLVVVFTRDFEQLGRVDADGHVVDTLPCPKLGPVIREYLGKLGVKLD